MRYRTPVTVTPLGRYECRHCGTRFAWQSTHPRGGARQPAYCSIECQQASRRRYRGDCICGARIMSHKPAACCSLPCASRSKNGWSEPLPEDHWALWYGAASPWSPDEGEPESTPIRILDCTVCHQPWVVPYWKSTRKACDYCRTSYAKSMRREAEHRRRARAKDAYVAPVFRLAIYERDRWTCQVCHRRIWRYRNAPPTHPRYPSLDHVVPLAEGGTHEPANVRLACLRCNNQRGARGGGEQLALVG